VCRLRAGKPARYSFGAAACYQGRLHQQDLAVRRHLLRLLKRFAELPRAARPEGSLPPCGWGDVATPIRPITDRPSLAPSSFTRCRLDASYEAPTPKGRQRAYHVPQVYRRWVRSRFFAGGATTACGEFGTPQPDHLPFGPSPLSKPPRGGHDLSRSPSSTFGLSSLTAFISVSPGLTVPPILAPDRLGAGSRGVGSRLGRPPAGGGYVVPEAPHPAVTSDARSGRILLAAQQVRSLDERPTATPTASCRTRTLD
jgi:hypothetical protein